MTTPSIVVRAWGIGGAVRDGGRVGWAHLGRGRGGAVDLAALALGNRLVGNAADTAGFETSGGLTVTVDAPTMVAITGSPADVTVDGGPPIGWGLAGVLPAGATLRVGRLRGGARTYVCVRGGVDANDGATPDRLVVGAEPHAAPSGDAAVPRPRRDDVQLWPGPRLDWFVEDAWRVLVGSIYTVQADSNRVGLRLDGPALARRHHGELPSEGMIEGSVQVPPDGHPIVMLADHPVTGGYPVIAVVDPADLGSVAQAPPGATLHFRAHR